MLWHGVLEFAQVTINGLIAQDVGAQAQLQQLQGKVLRIRCTEPAFSCLVWPSVQGLSLEKECWDESIPALDVDAEICGTSAQFRRFMLAGVEQERLLFQGQLQLSGDTQLVQRLQTILKTIDLDWSRLLESSLGTVPTALLLAPLKALQTWRQQALGTSQADWQEYLQYELSVLPSRHELHYYCNNINGLRQSTERLEARVQRLQSQLESLRTQDSTR